MHYRGHNVVTIKPDSPNILSDIKPRMVVTFLNDDGTWVALAYNDQGYVVEGKATNQTVAVDIAIDKAHKRLSEYAGYDIEKESEEPKKIGVIYWCQGLDKTSGQKKYFAQITLSISGKQSTISGNGMGLETALEHVALKLRGIIPD